MTRHLVSLLIAALLICAPLAPEGQSYPGIYTNSGGGGHWGDITNKPEIWVGDALYGATLQTAITAIGATAATLHIPAGTHSIAADLTIPANVTLRPERGATLAIATTKTLTINGGFEAGLYPVITCTGTGTVVFGDRVPVVFPQWFGAVGDNSTDDSAAINLAAAVARGSASKRLALPACTGYNAASQLDLQQLHIEGKATVSSSYDGHAVLIGNGSRLDIELSVTRSPAIRTAGTSGIWVSQLNYSTLTLASSNSYIGIKFEAGTGAMAYNTITLKNLHYNNTGLMVHVPAGVTGWANENLVIGGSFGGAVTGGLSAVTLLGEGTNAINKWSFIKPSFEISEGTAVITTKAQNCQFRDVRREMGDALAVATFNDRSYNNVISLGSSDRYFFWNYQTGGSYGAPGCDVRMEVDSPPFRLTDFASFNSAYHDGTYLHAPGFQLIDPSTGVVSRKLNTTNLKLIDGFGGAALVGTGDSYDNIGITVNFKRDVVNGYLSHTKKLYVKGRTLDKDQEPTVWVKCYDSAGNVLSGTTPAYVQGNRWTAVSTFYKIYASSPATNALSFHKDVAKALIGVAGSGNKLTGLEIYSPYQADGYLDYTGPKELPGALYAANAPTKWHFQVGDRVLNDATASGQPQGWTCTKRTSTTLTADGSGGDLTITVASITGIASGDIIGVKLNTGQYHFTTVNGAPAGNTVTLTAALPGSGVVATSGNAVVANLWTAMPNL
jgi:hypothetical protein